MQEEKLWIANEPLKETEYMYSHLAHLVNLLEINRNSQRLPFYPSKQNIYQSQGMPRYPTVMDF